MIDIKKEEVMQVSVIIATQNVVKYIEKCLSSLITYQDQGYIKEIIVVDGHSTDGTLDVINKYPVKLIFDEYRSPYVFSIPRNIGWCNAEGDLVMFLDADAYLSEGFFPGVLHLFENESVGVVGVAQKGVIKNAFMKTIAEWWHWHYYKNIRERSKSLLSLFWLQRLYHKVISFSVNETPSGPCYIVRRICLEAVGGFDELNKLTAEDVRLSLAVISNGWKAKWWFDAPVCHLPPSKITCLLKQRYKWGKGDGMLIQLSSESWFSKLIPPLVRLGTPVIGLTLAIRYRNPLQLLLFPLAHYLWIAGYFHSFINYKLRKTKVVN